MEMSDFALRLDAEIKALGRDRKSFASDVGIPYHRLDPWFRRPKAKPRGADLLMVARHLNVSQDYLLLGGERRPFDPSASLIEQAALLDDEGLRELENYARFLLQKQDGGSETSK